MGWQTVTAIGVLPATAALMVFVLIRRLVGGWSAPAAVAAAGMGCATGIAVGYLAAIRVLRVAPMRPEVGWHWLPWLAVGISIFAAAHASPRWSWKVTWPAAVLLALFAAWVAAPTWTSLHPPRPVWIALGTIAISAAWWQLNAAVGHGGGLSTATGVLILGTSNAVVLALTGNLKLGQLAGLAVAAFSGTALGGLLMRLPESLRGAVPGYCVFSLGLLLVGGAYSMETTSPTAYLLLAIAPALLGAAGSPAAGRLVPDRQWIVGLTVVLLLGGAAVWLSWPQEAW